MEKTKFSNLVDRLSVIAEKEKWIPRYDRELDHFFWTKEPISDNTALVKVSHETSLYVSPKGIDGVMVEYLSSNFVEHNPAYEGFVKQFTKRIDGSLYTIKSQERAEKYLFGLGDALRADIYRDAEEGGKKINIDNLVGFALKK